MDYNSTVSYNSSVADGVTFKLKRISHGRRIALNNKVASILTRINELSQSLVPIEDEIKRAEEAAKIRPCTCGHTDHFPESGRCKSTGCNCRKPEPDPEIGDYASRDKIQQDLFIIITNELYPAYIRWGISEVQGLNIDGQPATAESILDAGDERLVAEVGAEIQRMIRLGPDETLGFKPPTTSGAAVDGQMTTDPSTAQPASEASSMSSGTVAGSSPS